MSSRGKHRPHTGISLFAFLDVLICTMGALIILLMVLMRQASVDASMIVDKQAATATSEADEKALQEQLEDADWRRQLLEEQRLQHAEKLSSQRLELAHLEDHIRRLQDKWNDLQAQAQQLHQQGDKQTQSQEQAAAQLAAVTAEIEKAKQDLDEAKKRAAGKPRSFCIIPYAGPNGTSRRPIYIECANDLVTIQPEGVSLDARDFEGPLGPGNPLDACLRAVREYLARNPNMVEHGEPYPLLVVRPNGVVGYAAARAAMKSWEDEFGYELIEDDTELAYPKPDPTLRAILERAILDARRRQELLAAAAPSRYRGTATGQGMRGSPHGGFRDLMPSDEYGEEGTASGGGGGSGVGAGDSGRGFGNRKQGIGRGGGNPYNEGYAGGATNTGRGGGPNGEPGAHGEGGLGYGKGELGRNYGGGRGGQGNGRGAGTDGGNSDRAGGSEMGFNGPGTNNAGPGGGAAGGQANARPGNQANGQTGGQTGGQAGGQQGGQAGGQAGGQPGRPGQPGGAAGGQGQAGSSARGSGGDGSGDGSQAPVPNPNARPIASKRGTNWGLPNYTPKATGITRPIRIRVEEGNLMILPERGDSRSARVIPIQDSMVNATEELVSQIWDEVDSWGIAVAGGYWKPVLSVETAPGADARVTEFETLLDGSGLDVRRKTR